MFGALVSSYVIVGFVVVEVAAQSAYPGFPGLVQFHDDLVNAGPLHGETVRSLNALDKLIGFEN